jgi:hypothetical protein
MQTWYEIFIEVCPVCGDEQKYRERRHGQKPENPYHITEIYDYCMDWSFL